MVENTGEQNTKLIEWPVKLQLVFNILPPYLKNQDTFDEFIDKSTMLNFKLFCEALGNVGTPEQKTDIVQGLVLLTMQLHHKKDFDLSTLLHWCSCVAYELTEYEPEDEGLEEDIEEDLEDLSIY